MPDRPLNKVCYVEDDEDIQRIVRLSLERVGKMTVQIVGDPNTAIDVMKTFAPDLVLLDWMMPGLSGLDLCRALRSDPLTRGALIVMVTARVLDADRELAYAAGADHYVGKPFSPVALLETVRHAL
jgi:CheY-like chemotaxis protein